MERNGQYGYRLEIYYNSSLPNLITEPDSLLLEEQRSKKRSEEHRQTGLLFILLSYSHRHHDTGV